MKTKIVIQIKTDMNKFRESDFDESIKKEKDYDKDWDLDLTENIEESFHDAMHSYIENKLIDNDDFEQEFFEIMEANDNLPKKIEEMGDFGNISINISRENEEELKQEKEK